MLEKRSWTALRVIAGLCAAVLTIALTLYAPIGLGTESPSEMVVRTHVLVAVLLVGAASAWIVTIRPAGRVARLVASVTCGFNLTWIFSFVGLPVVVASLVVIVVAATGASRRAAVAVVSGASIGLVLGLLLFRITEPPGEHLFG